MKKLLLALLTTISPILFCMESTRTQTDLHYAGNRFYARFINKVKNGALLIFCNQTPAELNHALYVACLFNQFGSATAIIKYCKKNGVTLDTLYTQLGLLVAQIHKNKELTDLLNENGINNPIDINRAIYLSVKMDDRALFETVTSHTFDCENTLSTEALRLAIVIKNSFAIEQLQKLGVKLENVSPLKHPRISQIKHDTNKLQKLAKRKS